MELVDATVKYSRNMEVIANDAQYDGLYVIKSNVPKSAMSTFEVVEAYKSLINVEVAFRNMKTVQLEMRPIYHRIEDRIKAHVFICMLAYYLLWHMNGLLKELYEEDAKKYTQQHIIDLLKTQQKFDLQIGDIEAPSQKVAHPTKVQERIQNLVIGRSV